MLTWLKLVFSMPRYGSAMPTVHAVYVSAYYNGLGAELSLMAFFIALGRSFDALTDHSWAGSPTPPAPASAGASRTCAWPDLIQPRHHAARCAAARSTPGSWTNGGDDTGVALWLGSVHPLLLAHARVPYYSLKYELCTDNVERTKIFMYTIMAAFVGLLMGTAMPAGIELFVGEGPGLALIVTMVHFAVIYTIGMWGSALFIREPVFKGAPPKPKSFPAVFTRVLSTRAMIYFVGSETLEYATIYVMAAMLTFFASYTIMSPTGVAQDVSDAFVVSGMIGLSGFAMSIVSGPIWWRIYQRVGKRPAWMAQSMYNGISNLLLLMPLAGRFGLAMAFFLINAFAFGGQFLMDSTLADIIEYDQFLYGDRVDGMFASTAYFLPKAVGAFANAIPLTLMYSSGFVKPLRGCPDPVGEAEAYAAMVAVNGTCEAKDIRNQPQSPGVVWTIRLLTGLLPAVASIAALGFKRAFYLYPSHMANIQQGIAALTDDPTTPYKDPVTGMLVRWLPQEKMTDKEKALCEMLDVFPMNALRRALAEKSFASLRARSVRGVAMVATVIGAALAVTITTVRAGWLLNQTLNIVPTMGCICIGAGFTVAAIAVPRLRTATHLHAVAADPAEGFPEAFLAKYCGRFQVAAESTTALQSL